MDNDAAPNFSYAYGGAPATTPAASWNPALRHEKEGDSAAIAQPPAKPRPESSSDEEEEEDDDDDDDEEEEEEDEDEQGEEDEDEDESDEDEDEDEDESPQAPANRGTYFGEHKADSDSLARIDAVKGPQDAHDSIETKMHERQTSGTHDDAPTSATQALKIQDQTAAQAKQESSDGESDEESDEESSEEEEAALEERPAENYEHQGESTAMEEALGESVKVPLVADTEAATDDAWGHSDDQFILHVQPQPTPLETPHTEAGGTTIGDKVIGNTSVGGNAGEDIDWGNTEEQEDFFGGIASQAPESAHPNDQSSGAHGVVSEAQPLNKNEWDLDLDLDDEFLPDSENAPVFDLSDDEGFLEDEPSAPAPQAQSTPSASTPTSRYAPQTAQGAPPSIQTTNSYSPLSPQFASLPQQTQQRPAAAPAYNGFGQNLSYLQQQQKQQEPTRPAMTSSAQSFADKSKGGYASPYDLPDDIVTTRKRAAPRPAIPASQPTPPPPRTSSMSSNAGPPHPIPSSSMSAASLSPPSSGHSMQTQMTGLPPSVPSKPAPPTKSSSSDFFAELPITSRPKPSGRYTSQQNAPSQPPAHHAPPQLTPKERTASWSSLRNEVLPDSATGPPPLRQPEQLPMFPNQPSVPARTNSLPVPHQAPLPTSNRYSPAPSPSIPSANARYSPAPPSAPTSSARYSPAPPSGFQGQSHARYASEPPTVLNRTPSQPFAPRTSSPLAFHSVPHQQEQPAAAPETTFQQPPGHHVSQSADGMPRPPFRSPLEGVSEIEEQGTTLGSGPPTAGRSETPPLRSTPSSIVGSPRKKGNYTPQYQPSNAALPSRSHSQSPSASMKQPVRSHSTNEQLGSVYGLMSPPSAYSAQRSGSSPVNIIPHRRQASLNYEAIVPEDERAADPLQRWKGYPIFTWGLGGTVVTSFPKQIPRYGGGASAPVMKCSPGEVRLQNVKEFFPLPENVATFPGPLKTKGKKKDVIAWLGRSIDALETQLKEPGLEHSLTPDELKRLEDRTLLWKLLQILVEHDGKLEEGAAGAAIRKLLSPEGTDAADPDTSFSTAADIVGRSRSNTSNLQAEPVDPRAIEDLQSMLTKGDREKAVWHAVDQRLWGHAMLLSSTLSKDIWKQVVQEFVRKEVKKVGRNNQALAVLYEVFAGNHEDCIDELVPASARAGFQMVSADGAGPAQNALQGLDKWRETVALVLNNRSEGDASALLSLGRLLSQYGRVEAAHICFIFARSVLLVSGVDDAQADVVLIGADHRKSPLELGIDLEPILLTEIYEFALSLSAQSGSYIIPHLQNYKLAHAYQLAEYGHRTDAQAYCDAIAAAMKATTRISPYYNASFIASLDDLSKRLSQSPKDGSSSWISKPSMDKVGSSLLSKFNSFIAGDDEDAASNPSASVEVGPFAKIAGNSPSITPSLSSADLYGAYSGYGAPVQQPAPANSRYAPSNTYAPRTSSEQQRSRYEPQGRLSMESADGSMMRAVSDSYMPITPTTGSYSPSQSQLSPPRQAKSQSYSPLRAEHNASQPSYGSPYLPTPPVEELSSAPTFGGYQPPQASFDEPPPSAGHEQPYGGYEPPSSTFEAPSYQPYNPDEEDKPEEDQPRKKSFMEDDDDDLVTRAAALKISSGGKSEADRKADEAFRKAAEADAQRDKEAAAAKKGGWFGGWFKKDPHAAPGPIKAKLGEENSFVYDPELKKWVNKKGGSTEAGKSTATPPPPRGGPPGGGAGRSASGGAMMAMGPPQGGLMRPPTSNPGPQRSSSMPPPMALPGSRASTPGIPSDSEGAKPPTLVRPSFGAASGPPSRPGTGMSNASSIDDLLGAPQARKGAGAKKKKGGRYVDVMAQGS
ncbi:Nn.00g078030.m01.CDS01 [Neocucurbitaria sp. VM-36]